MLIFFLCIHLFVCFVLQELREIITNILVEVCSLDDEGKVAWSALLDIIHHILYTHVSEKNPY